MFNEYVNIDEYANIGLAVVVVLDIHTYTEKDTYM